MKTRRPTLWLLRDVPALLGIMLTYWPLMILVITNGFAAMRGKKVARSVFDAIPMLLAKAEARLDFALWREAYRRLGWDHRRVQLSAFAPPQTWAEIEQRFDAYSIANTRLEATVRAYAEHLRQLYGINERELAAHGSTDARLCRAAHHELFSRKPSEALILSSARSARPSKDERGYAHARGPPPIPISRRTPRRPHLRDRPTAPIPPNRTYRPSSPYARLHTRHP